MAPKILALAIAIGVASSAVAQRGGAASADPVAGAAQPTPADSFAQAIAARSVADFARRQHDVMAMMTAARMLQEIPFSDTGADDGAFTPAGLFAEARTMAKNDPALLMQITVAQSTGSRGVVQSPFGKGLVRSIQTVAPGGGYQFLVQAAGGTPLRVGAIGDTGTALLLRMQDGAGHVVCLDDHGDYGPVCELNPKAAARYRIEIVNKSAVKSRAVILSN